MDGNQAITKQPQSKVTKTHDQHVLDGRTEFTDDDDWQTTDGGVRDGFMSGTGVLALENMRRLEVEQRIDTLEACLGWARNSRYCIYNEEGDQIFYVYEASVCCLRQVIGAMRGLVLRMTDEDQAFVIRLRRPLTCSSRLCWLCCNLQRMDILQPNGTIVATVHEVWSCCLPHFRVLDGDGQLLWTVTGSCCHCRCCCCQISFQFAAPDEEVCATVSRSWQGCKELIGSANSFCIEFSDKLTAKQKLTVLSASFLIDLNYFEKQNKCW